MSAQAPLRPSVAVASTQKRRGRRGRIVERVLNQLLCSDSFDIDAGSVENADRFGDYRLAYKLRLKYSRARLASWLRSNGFTYATEDLVRRAPSYKRIQQRLNIRRPGVE